MNDTLEIPRGTTGAFTAGALAIGDGAKTGPAIAADVHYAIAGLGFKKTGAATVRPLAAGTVIPASSKCLFVIQADSAGTITSVQGNIELTADLTANKRVLNWPEPASGKCPVGAVKIETGATTFTPGTTALDAANITVTYYNFVGGMPTAPLTS
jgi:hypothetical protein